MIIVRQGHARLLHLSLVCLFAFLLDMACALGAGEPEPSGGIGPEDLEPPPRLQTAGYVYGPAGAGAGAFGGRMRRRLEGALATLVRVDPRLSFVDPQEAADPPEVAITTVRAAYQLVDEARDLLFAGTSDTSGAASDPHPAPAALSRAEALLLRAIPVQARELGHGGDPQYAADLLKESFAYLATTYYLRGDLTRARTALSTVYNFGYGPPSSGRAGPAGQGRLSFEPRLYPDSMRPFVEQSQQQFAAVKPGRAALDSTPSGARVLVAGRRVEADEGQVVLDNVPAGDIYVTWLRRNYRPLTLAVRVPSGGTVNMAPRLSRFWERDPLERLEVAEGQLGAGEMPFPLVEAASLLQADLLMLLSYRKQDPGGQGDPGRLLVTGYVYDRRVRRLLRKAQLNCSADLPLREVEQLGQALLRGIKLQEEER